MLTVPASGFARRPACPNCSGEMALSHIEPEEPGYDRRTFVCKACGYSETVIARYRAIAMIVGDWDGGSGEKIRVHIKSDQQKHRDRARAIVQALREAGLSCDLHISDDARDN